jgi:hypothetical protein
VPLDTLSRWLGKPPMESEALGPYTLTEPGWRPQEPGIRNLGQHLSRTGRTWVH